MMAIAAPASHRLPRRAPPIRTIASFGPDDALEWGSACLPSRARVHFCDARTCTSPAPIAEPSRRCRHKE
jgi:hypothetical protein